MSMNCGGLACCSEAFGDGGAGEWVLVGHFYPVVGGGGLGGVGTRRTGVVGFLGERSHAPGE